ncbi:L-dopachrome tautomerase-related protein [Verrucomicrobium sp. GAS474]|uniref:L-dopachrome tautomerase-related protein n=1 Tax=Verrucomicrobium sp. GAS474 TaxID=1882831 RepID=UPI000B88D9D3|nr:L-dopachrome tautomerase-related protein [Verrucomicrobium sp. GAS474]
MPFRFPALVSLLLLLAGAAALRADTPSTAVVAAPAPAPKPAPAPVPPSSPALEEVFADPTYQFTGVAVSVSGRLFVCYPYWLDAHRYSVVEVAKDGSTKPYPDATWNSFQKGENGQDKFVCAQAVYADDWGSLWVVDSAGIGLGDVYQHANKVVRIDLKTNKVTRVYRFPEAVAGAKSYLNDIRVDGPRGFAYLTSSSNGGIVVLNLATGESRLVLHGHPSTLSDPAYRFVVDGRELATAAGPAKIHSDGIALSPDRNKLYFKPLTDNKLYRIDTELLRDPKVPEMPIESAVESLGRFVATDGMEMDAKGNLYLGDIENNRIIKITPDLQKLSLIQDSSRLLWPDSYSLHGGYLYLTCSQINLMPAFHDGQNRFRPPFRIYRLKL